MSIAAVDLEHFKLNDKSNSFLISFEGIEGCGKTTQIQLFKSYLESQDYTVTVLREPGGTSFGEALRASILNAKTKLAPIAEAYLFASSRAQLLTEMILPLLEKKRNVIILDRYIDSSIAYQGFARNLGIETILNIHRPAPLNIFPNLTFYLKISIDVSLKRQQIRNNKKDYFEQENNLFYQSLIKGYQTCASIFSDRVKTINAEVSIDEVQKNIIKLFQEIV